MTRPAKRPVVLIVRDGWGHNPDPAWDHANAVRLAETPIDDALQSDYPHVQIRTSGEDVGLPPGVMGNSEVGHQNIGAGRVVDQEVMRITRTIREGTFFTNPTLLAAFDHARAGNVSLHIMGLVSDGRVHSDLQHALALIELAGRLDFPSDRLFVHAFTDGRDTSPFRGIGFVTQLEKKLAEVGVGRIASVCGRYYAMDRDNRWDRVEKAYRMLTRGGDRVFAGTVEAIQDYYDSPSEESRRGDEFILPVSVSPSKSVEDGQKIRSGDAVIFFNYRGDRPRELSKAFVLGDEAWTAVQGGGFDRGQPLQRLYFATMTAYEEGLPVQVVFHKPPKMENILGIILSKLGMRQFRCAETEKYAHVTFFFNDYREPPFPGEERRMIPSPRHVSTYDKQPEMSAQGVTDAVLKRIESDADDLIVVNFANGDMVGHTGVLGAAITAVEAVDRCVGLLTEAVLKKGGALVVTADHGNCEQMIDPETGGPHTAHTTFDVDLIVVAPEVRGRSLREGGRLADVAPTLLDLMGLPVPPEMTGRSLLQP